MASNATNTLPRITAGVAAAFVLIVGLATILGAWAFQIFGGFIPCPLCLEQRWPYYIGLPVVLVAVVSALAGGPAWLTRLALLLAALIFAYGAYLGIFHAGVEYAWWPGPPDCAVTAGPVTGTTGDLLDQIDNIRVVSCTEASWRFPDAWGLSFAGWNAAISALLALVALGGAARGAKEA
jgi:disulfide bond formation protein DsbB